MKRSFFLLIMIIHLQSNSQHVLKISSGTLLKTGESIFIVSENTSLVNDGNLQQVSGAFKFTGDADVFISGKNASTFSRLIMSKTGTAKLKLLQHISIVKELNFSAGLLDLSDFNIDLGTTGLLSGENESTHAIGRTGYIQIVTDLNSPNNFNPGNLGAVFTSEQNLGNTVIRRGHQLQANVNGEKVLRYYDIRPANKIGLNTTLRFSYFNTELNGLEENNLTLWQSADNSNWTNLGFNTRNITTNYLERSMGPDRNNNHRSSHFVYCIASDDMAARIKKAGNNSDFIGKNDWKAWPNPVAENLWINISASEGSKASIKIYDDRGALVRLEQHSLSSGNNLLNVDMKKMAAGTYFIFTNWGNGQMQKTKKVVKM
jgi:hypothetical protein